MDPNPLLSAALDYAARGWRVVPLNERQKNPWVGDWPNVATTDPDAIRGWWAERPASNVGVALGPGSGLVGVDIDSEEGERLLREMSGGDLPPTLDMATGKGARLLYSIPDGLPRPPKTTVIAGADGKEAIRFQSTGGQCVMPPSVHPTGRRYEWRSPAALEAAPMPAWMVMTLCPPAETPEHYESTASRAFTAGGDFNKRGSWEELLTAHGFTPAGRRDQVRYYTRPGKGGGVSVTLGYYRAKDGTPALYVFSGNVPELLAGKCYDLFGAFARLEHRGDFPAASRALEGMGFGPPRPGKAAANGGGPAGGDVFGAGHTAGCGRPDDDLPADFDFATNADFKSLNLTTAWVWKGWLQGGVVNLVASEAGMGKTRWIADLCRRVHHRLPWPDGQPMQADDRPHLVMWVAADSQFAELVELSEGFGFGPRICYSGSKQNPVGGISLDSADDFKTLYRRLKAARPLFLIVDTAGGATDANLSRQEEARRFFAPLSHIAVSLGICVVVVTHLNATQKVLGRRAEERVRCVIRLWAADKRPETPRRIEVLKSNHLFPQPIGMTLHGHGSDYTDTPPSPPEAAGGGAEPLDRGPPTKVRECADWLTEQVAETPQRVAKLIEAAELAGFNRSTLYRTMRHLKLIETSDGKGHKWWGMPGGESDDEDDGGI